MQNANQIAKQFTKPWHKEIKRQGFNNPENLEVLEFDNCSSNYANHSYLVELDGETMMLFVNDVSYIYEVARQGEFAYFLDGDGFVTCSVFYSE